MMSFARPLMLFLLILPLAWMLLIWSGRLRRGSWWLLASLTAIVLATSKPQFTLRNSKVALTLLADTSSNISDSDLKKESDFIHNIEQVRGRNELRGVPFAQIPGNRTLPAGRVPRMVMMSDGRENIGDVLRAAGKVKKLGIPIDTIPLSGRRFRDMSLDMAALPTATFAGERFPIDLVVTSPSSVLAQIVISSGHELGRPRRVLLRKGVNHVRVYTTLAEIGEVQLSMSMRAGNVGELRVSQSMSVHRPRALFVSPRGSGVAPRFIKALASAHFELIRAGSVPANLSDDQLVLLDFRSRPTIPEEQQLAIQDFVRQGGVLVAIGREQKTAANAGVRADPIDLTLPAILGNSPAIPSSCFVLVLEKSRSMSSTQMELAQLSALEIIENLSRKDLVGVLAFDDAPHWLVPIRTTNERASIVDRIESINRGGGTQIAPALGEALRQILSTTAVSKHIIFITDGRSRDIDTVSLAAEARAQHVTITTVGLVDDVNHGYLAKLARSTAGDSYLIREPWDVEQTLSRDAIAYGSSSFSNAFGPSENAARGGVPSWSASVPNNVGRFHLKPEAQVVVSDERGDPLLIRRRYGVGQAEIVTSPVLTAGKKSPLPSKVSEAIWQTVSGEIPDDRVKVAAHYDPAHDQFVIDYRAEQRGQLPAVESGIYVSGPRGIGIPLHVERVSEALFRARVSCNHASGLFRVRSLDEKIGFPQILLYTHDQEPDDHGTNDLLLRQVSELTGGSFNPDPRDIFDPNGRTATWKVDLWSALAAAAIVFVLASWILPRRQQLAAKLEFAATRHRVIHP